MEKKDNTERGRDENQKKKHTRKRKHRWIIMWGMNKGMRW